MGKYTQQLKDMLTEFVIAELGVNAIYGVTYAFFLKDSDKDMQLFERYSAIRTEANSSGFSSAQIIRIFELSNGYIIDLDLNVVRDIVISIWNFANQNNVTKVDPSIFVGDKPEKKRRKDMDLLAKNCKRCFDKGNTEYVIALFNRNKKNRIVFTASSVQDGKEKRMSCAYDAFELRQWDIETLNSEYLIKAGFRVASVQPLGILPTKTGVAFSLVLESMDKYYNLM